MSLRAQTVRFGPFRLDLRSAELHRNGTKVKLSEQPFQVLSELVEHPGEIVTREQLRQRLWRSDTFVDFEHGLNSAVMHLREALGDTAENPQYVETLPRHGYRLMVPVETAEAAALETASGARRKIWLTACLLFLAALVVGPRWQRTPLTRFQPQKVESVAVLPFVDLYGNPKEVKFARSLTEALTTELGKLPSLRVISHQSVLRYQGTSASVPQIARELGVDALVEGSVFQSGGRVRVTTQLILANPERHLWSETYEHVLTDEIVVQQQLASAIVQEIKARLNR